MQTLKALVPFLFVCAAAVSVTAPPAIAASVLIDELKNDVVRLTFSLQSGGSFVLCESGVAAGGRSCINDNISDVVVFDAEHNTASMDSDKNTEEFPKDVEIPGDTTADLKLVAQQNPPALFQPEEVSENRNEVSKYTPKVDQPGFALVDETPVTYEIFSDTTIIPEPSSVLLLAFGLVSPLLLKFFVNSYGARHEADQDGLTAGGTHTHRRGSSPLISSQTIKNVEARRGLLEDSALAAVHRVRGGKRRTRASMAARRGPQCEPKLVPQTPMRSRSTSGCWTK